MNILAKNYEIIRELGRGGAGSVYLAHDKKLDRQVAVKMLELDSNLDKSLIHEMQQRFEKEAKAIARLNHPNIVDIYDFGEENGKHFMVIELLKGESLSSQINKIKNLPIEKILDMGLQLCSAISYAHSQGVIHRDIKPANVMLLDNYKVKLTDFGIAQLHNDKLALTQAGSILGSILYIPPEQLVDSRKVDKRADVYSLGVTLFQLLTGRLPFEGNSVAEVVTKILNQEIPLMSSFKSSIPEALDRVILKAIKKEPEERYQNIEDLAEALKEIKEYIKNVKSQPSTLIKSDIEKPKIISNNEKTKAKYNFKYIFPILVLLSTLGLATYIYSKTDKSVRGNSSNIIATPKADKTFSPVSIKTSVPQSVKSVKPANPTQTPVKAINSVKPIIKKVPATQPVNITKPKPIQKYNRPIKTPITPIKRVNPKPVYTAPKKIVKAPVRKVNPVIQPKRTTAKPVIKRTSVPTKKTVGEGY